MIGNKITRQSIERIIQEKSNSQELEQESQSICLVNELKKKKKYVHGVRGHLQRAKSIFRRGDNELRSLLEAISESKPMPKLK